jgi:DNA-binding transcriptional LysR family regulator
MLAKGRLSCALTRPVLQEKPSGLQTLLLRKERFGIVVPVTHPLAERQSILWRALANEPLVILARREGVGSHESILAACQSAKFTPRFAYTPSLIGTVLSYVEAGAGIGVVPESISTPKDSLRFVPLKPAVSVPLVLVWREDEDTPAVQRFRELVIEWQRADLLWKGPSQLRRIRSPG